LSYAETMVWFSWTAMVLLLSFGLGRGTNSSCCRRSNLKSSRVN